MKNNLSNYDNFDDVYRDNVKSDVESGRFFNDGYDYFLNAFLRPIVDRTFFIFISIVSTVIIYFVIGLISFVLPLKEEINVTIKERDITRYWINIEDLTNNNEAETTDEDILRYLIVNYVKERETHNYKEGNINDVNKKITRIQNNSVTDVNNGFRWFMSKANENGPYYYFGKDIETKIEINSFKFNRVNKNNLFNKIKFFFDVSVMPIGAEVNYTLVIISAGEIVLREKRKAAVEFNYVAVEKEKDDTFTAPKFTVNSYKNYKIK
jgi:type IV secretory pathway component VirB8